MCTTLRAVAASEFAAPIIWNDLPKTPFERGGGGGDEKAVKSSYNIIPYIIVFMVIAILAVLDIKIIEGRN